MTMTMTMLLPQKVTMTMTMTTRIVMTMTIVIVIVIVSPMSGNIVCCGAAVETVTPVRPSDWVSSTAVSSAT